MIDEKLKVQFYRLQDCLYANFFLLQVESYTCLHQLEFLLIQSTFIKNSRVELLKIIINYLKMLIDISHLTHFGSKLVD